MHKLNGESTTGVQNLILNFNDYTFGYLSLAGKIFMEILFLNGYLYTISE